MLIKDWKCFEKAVAYQYTYRSSHILPALMVKCHFKKGIPLYLRST